MSTGSEFESTQTAWNAALLDAKLAYASCLDDTGVFIAQEAARRVLLEMPLNISLTEPLIRRAVERAFVCVAMERGNTGRMQ